MQHYSPVTYRHPAYRPERLVRDGLGYRVISVAHLTDERLDS
jgi:hypothetical protein